MNSHHVKRLKNLNPVQAIKGKEKHFSDRKYIAKVFKYAKKIGIKICYYSLLLYYAFKSPQTPKSAKLTIAGALGYLILPVDLIPDFIPVVGFADDAAIIVSALYRVVSHIDGPMKLKADDQMKNIFGNNYDQQSIDVDFKPE